MKSYRITVEDGFGEKFIVTLNASSIYEAIKHIETDKGWNVTQIEVI